MKRVVVGGLEGRMGSFLVEALKVEEDITLVASVSEVECLEGETPIYNDIDKVLAEVDFDVYIDFTVYTFANEAAEKMLKAGKSIVIGTTGFNKEDVDYLKAVAKEYGGRGVIAPNFDNFEIVEYHHVNKKDQPSGTATYIANTLDCALKRKLASTHVHSVRMPGVLAKHQVLVSDEYQTLELIHQSNSRHSFEKGIILAIRKVGELDELVYGLQHLLD